MAGFYHERRQRRISMRLYRRRAKRARILPVLDEHGFARRAESGGVIIAGGRAIAGCSGNGVVAGGDQMKHRGVARSLKLEEAVKRGVGVSLAGSRLLVYQGH